MSRKKKNGIQIKCKHCNSNENTMNGGACWHCEGTGKQWLYSRGAIARCFTGFLDGMLSRKQLKAISSRPSRAIRRAQSAEKRKYERRRKKHDQWVEPKGPRPEKREKSPAIIIQDKLQDDRWISEPDYDLCIDPHHTDEDGDDVLYEMNEFLGEFSFRDTILEQLDRYLYYVKRMKVSCPSDYDLYRQVGAILVPYMSNADIRNKDGSERDTEKDKPKTSVSPWFLKTMPMFGCIAYGTSLEIEKIEQQKSDGKIEIYIPKFLYFTKFKKPPVGMEWRSGGTHYVMTIYWDKKLKNKRLRKGGIPQCVGIFVEDGGKIHVLKSLKTKWLRRKYKTYDIPQRAWEIPSEYSSWAESHGETVQDYISDLFYWVGDYIEKASYSMIRVEASKRGVSCYFNVDLDRVPYFFSDRDYTLTTSGLRKPIFHTVRAHQRKNGSFVKLHFRGQKQFTWADCIIRITIPGLDHSRLEEIAIGAYDEGHPEVAGMTDTTFLSTEEAGKTFIDHVHKRGQFKDGI